MCYDKAGSSRAEGQGMAPFVDRERERKLYSQTVVNKTFPKKFKLIVKSNEKLPPDTFKGLLKSK